MEDTSTKVVPASTTIKFESDEFEEVASQGSVQLRLLPMSLDPHQTAAVEAGFKLEPDHPFSDLMSPLHSSLSLSPSSERMSAQGFCEFPNDLDYTLGADLQASLGASSDTNLTSTNCQDNTLAEHTRANRRKKSRPQSLKRRSSSSSSSGSAAARSRIKKQITHEELMAQRNQANIRERQRTQSLNQAYTMLRESIPTLPSDKMSKIQTLKLASEYIEFLDNVLRTSEVNPRSDIVDHNDGRRAQDTLAYEFNLWRINIYQNGKELDFVRHHSPELT